MSGVVEKAVLLTLSRRVLILVLALVTLVLGVIVYRRMSVELVPKGMQQPEVSVQIPVDSANPSEVQESIIRLLEYSPRATVTDRCVGFEKQGTITDATLYREIIDLLVAVAEAVVAARGR